MNGIFSSESVTEGHPDKIADFIADRVLDECLKNDPYSRVAAEVNVMKGKVILFGEITTADDIDYEKIVREAIRDVGYCDDDSDFSADGVEVVVNLHTQSPDIAMGLHADDLNGGAGDQGIMFGYASDESKVYMPLPITYAHRLSKKLSEVRKEGILDYLGPDGKTQVSMEYDGIKPRGISTIIVSSQHSSRVQIDRLRYDIMEKVINKTDLGEYSNDCRILINPTGRFVVGGPEADAGLTGRKLIVDTYGGYSRHGGGAFSGKDPSKTDRSGAYMARFLAKNIVAAEIAKRCEVGLAYAIGVAEPVGVFIDTFSTGVICDDKILEMVKRLDLRPNAIIERFNLRRPIYSSVTNYGHFGENAASMPWEVIDSSLFA